MTALSFRHGLLLTAAALSLGARPALAETQDQPIATGAADSVVSEVVVAGQRRSQARAVQEQRESLTVANVVSAEELQVT